MPKSYQQIFIHLIWSTWDRMPLITDDIESALHKEMCHQAQKLRCQVIAIGGTLDHVHFLLRVPSTVCISEIVKEVKGASSFFINDAMKPEHHFKWQGSYSAFSVSSWNVALVANYIAHQKEHHAQNTTKPKLEVE